MSFSEDIFSFHPMQNSENFSNILLRQSCLNTALSIFDGTVLDGTVLFPIQFLRKDLYYSYCILPWKVLYSFRLLGVTAANILYYILSVLMYCGVTCCLGFYWTQHYSPNITPVVTPCLLTVILLQIIFQY